MPYTVQFVGLVCFLRERGGRLALLPDGRDPENGIAPHFGSIIVAPEAVQNADGWNGMNGSKPGNFPLDGCEVVIESADAPGVLDTAGHQLPQLRERNPDFEIDPARAQTVARLHIRQGTLTSHRIPGGEALISQLDVLHDGPISIRVKPDDGSDERTIILAPGTEIAVTNMGRANMYLEKRPTAPVAANSPDNHFKIYEKLSATPVSLQEPDTVPSATESESRHVLFSRRGGISLYTNCSNTGCC
jgi:hypothetical protein